MAESANYRSLFKSTVLLGGTQVFVTIFALIRVKVVAIFLGPAGVGLLGMYMSITGVIGTLAGLGVVQSGVRRLAEVQASGEEEGLRRTVRSIRQVVWATALAGAIGLLLFSSMVSELTFGNDQHQREMALLGVALLCSGFAGGELAVLQGLRKHSALAWAQIVAAVAGSVATVLLVLALKQGSLAWIVFCNAGVSAVVAWVSVRKLGLRAGIAAESPSMPEIKGLVGLGLAFMVVSLLGSVFAYASRVIIKREMGVDAVGQYHAAFTLSSYYVAFILTAMGTDFFPRLTAVVNQPHAAAELMNQQVDLGMLMALPGVVGTLVFSPLVLKVFYSQDFLVASAIIQWQVIGVFYRMVSWPLWHIQAAKGMSTFFIGTEAAFTLLQIALLWGCMKTWGLEGLGASSFLSYALHVLAMYWMARVLVGFRWGKYFWPLFACTNLCIGASLITNRFAPAPWNLVLGFGVVVAACAFSAVALSRLLGINMLEKLRAFTKRRSGAASN